MTETKINYNLSKKYIPRRYFKSYHTRTQRWSVLVCHRRSGKTVATLVDMLAKAFYTTRQKAQYIYLATTREHGKTVAWEYLKDLSAPYRSKIKNAVSESALRITLQNGSTVRIMSAEKPEKLRGIYIDGIVLDEYAFMACDIFDSVIRPALVDSGGWATFISTPLNKNHFFELYQRARPLKEWYTLFLPVSDTDIIPLEEQDQMRKTMDSSIYAREFMCSFEVGLAGCYFLEQMEELEKAGRINPSVQYNPQYKVSVSFDLGMKDPTVMWFWQEIGGEIFVIDYEADTGRYIDYYGEVLAKKRYTYKGIYLPHDAQASHVTGKSSQEQLYEYSVANDLYFPLKAVDRLRKQASIDAVRKVLRHCYFNSITCHAGISALKSYRKQYSRKENGFLDKPVHDWASHPADSFQYACIAMSSVKFKAKKKEQAPQNKQITYDDVFPLNNGDPEGTIYL